MATRGALPARAVSRATACSNGVDELGYLLARAKPTIDALTSASAHEGARSRCSPATASAPRSPPRRCACCRPSRARFGHEFELQEAPFGGVAIDAVRRSAAAGDARRLPSAADAVLLGRHRRTRSGPHPHAHGAPRSRDCCGCARRSASTRTCARCACTRRSPRPRRSSPRCWQASTCMFVRELTGGIYFGAKHRAAPSAASDLCSTTVAPRSSAWCAWPRSWRAAAAASLTSIDKANVLETSRLWREVAERDRAARSSPTCSSSTCWWTPPRCT